MIYDKKAILIIDEALKTYLAELDYIRHLCKDPYVGNEPILRRIQDARDIKKEVHRKRMELYDDVR